MSDDFLIRMEQRRIQRDRRKLALDAEMSALVREAEEDAVAIRRYREVMEVKSEGAFTIQGGTRVFFGGAPHHGESIVAARQNEAAGLSRKDMVLTILRKVYPGGLKAKQIRGRAAANFRIELNPNTLTVTLGRYRVERAVRNVGRTWYFVPEDQREEPSLLNGRIEQMEGNA